MRTEILVTGGSGLLGHALRQELPEAVFLSSRDGDLRNHASAEQIFAQHQPRIVIHLAAQVAGVKKNAASNADLFSDNILINTHVLSLAARFGAERVIGVLSTCAYPFFENSPTQESDLHSSTLPFAGNLGYGYAKRALDIHTKLIAEQYGIRASTITPVTMFGTHDNWDLENGHVIASLIHRCFLAKQNGSPLSVWGSGRAVRQFVFAPDVARIVRSLTARYDGPETLIVAPDGGMTIRDLAALVAGKMNFTGPIVFDDSQPEGQVKKTVRSSKFAIRFPGFEFTTLSSGLEQTVAWFERHQPSCLEKAEAC